MALRLRAIFDSKASETICRLRAKGGGIDEDADNRQLAPERLHSTAANRLTQLDLLASKGMSLAGGDLLRTFNAAIVVRLIGQKNKLVRVEGEGAKPGEYLLPPDGTLRTAGGIAEDAYLYATKSTRESVIVAQQQSYGRTLRNLESQVNNAPAKRRTGTCSNASATAIFSAANGRLIQQARLLKTTGRVVLQLKPTSDTWPEMVLEDGNGVSSQARPITACVFSWSSSSHSLHRKVCDYLRLACGQPRSVDDTSRVRDPCQWLGQQQPEGDPPLCTRQIDRWTATNQAWRHDLCTGRVEQGHLDTGHQGVDADLLPDLPWAGWDQEHDQMTTMFSLKVELVRSVWQ